MSRRRRRYPPIGSINDVPELLPPQPSTALVPVAAVGNRADSAPAAETADEQTLTPELVAQISRMPACQHCGGRHARACPRVRKMQWHPNASLAAVEFWPDGDWDETKVIWPEQLAAAATTD